MQENTALRTQHAATLVELDRYKLIIESIQDYAIFLLDKDGYVATWNKGAEKIKGYKANEIIGRHFSSFYSDADKKAKKPEREMVIVNQFGRVEDEGWRVRKDGTQFWANVVITALYDPLGELVGYAKITRDLTERKRHEDALRKANRMLKAQQRELEKLNTSKDEFISLASHQLRTPATSIKQYLGMILEGFVGETPPKQEEFIQKAYENNQHQLSIVGNLLKVAQIDAGKVVLHRVPTDMGKLLRAIADEHGESFNSRSQSIKIDIPSDLSPVMVDPAYIRMALENLVDNASKYTPKGGAVTISAQNTDHTMKISIQDTGVGIAPEDVTKLFEKFSRIPNMLSETVGGTGLGLYWVNKVILLHGGRVEVQSKVGKGTTFDVYLPIRQINA